MLSARYRSKIRCLTESVIFSISVRALTSRSCQRSRVRAVMFPQILDIAHIESSPLCGSDGFAKTGEMVIRENAAI